MDKCQRQHLSVHKVWLLFFVWRPVFLDTRATISESEGTLTKRLHVLPYSLTLVLFDEVSVKTPPLIHPVSVCDGSPMEYSVCCHGDHDVCKDILLTVEMTLRSGPDIWVMASGFVFLECRTEADMAGSCQ